MKTFTTILLMLLITTAFSQTKKELPVIFGQEMSKIKVDSKYKQYSIVEINYRVEGSTIQKGDTLYHNNLVTIDAAGYPYDHNYQIKKVYKRPGVYKVVALR